MRWLPKAIPLLIGIIALDFALVFGFEAWRIFSSSISGLERTGFANVVYGIGGLAGLESTGIVRLAALFGVVNLAVAILFVFHLATRVGNLWGRSTSHELLDAGLILVVASTIVAATPAILQGATDILIQERFPLWLVGLAATLSMIERLPDAEHSRRPGFCERLLTRKSEETFVVAPVMRNATPSLRWNVLRRDAGMTTQPALVKQIPFALH